MVFGNSFSMLVCSKRKKQKSTELETEKYPVPPNAQSSIVKTVRERATVSYENVTYCMCEHTENSRTVLVVLVE